MSNVYLALAISILAVTAMLAGFAGLLECCKRSLGKSGGAA